MLKKFSAFLTAAALVITCLVSSQPALAAEPAAPDITVISLKDAQCNFMVIVSYPLDSLPDEGSQRMRLAFPAENLEGGVAFVNLVGQGSEKLTKTVLRGQSISSGIQPGDAWQFNGDSNFNTDVCNRDLNVEVTYKSQGVTSSTGLVTGLRLAYAPQDRIYAHKIITDRKYCDIYVDYGVTTDPDEVAPKGRTATITYTEPEFSATFEATNPHDNDYFVFRFETEEIVDSEATIQFLGSNKQIQGCSGNGVVSLAYTSLGILRQESSDVFGLSECGPGTFSETGFQFPGHFCDPASPGYYVEEFGATKATACPEGSASTWYGSSSINDCIVNLPVLYPIVYSSGNGPAPTTPELVEQNAGFVVPQNTFIRSGYTFAGWTSGGHTYQPGDMFPAVTEKVTLTAKWLVTPTAKKIVALKVLKKNAVKTLSATTDQGKPISVKASGACKARVFSVKGKRLLRITASPKSGTCLLKLSSPATSKVAGFELTHRIRVSTSGK